MISALYFRLIRVVGILLQTVTLKELEDYKEAAMHVFDKNSDGRLSRKELGLLLSIDK